MYEKGRRYFANFQQSKVNLPTLFNLYQGVDNHVDSKSAG